MNGDQPDQYQIQQPLRELAAEVLDKEKAAPGSQDPELVRWATDKLSGNQTAMPAPAAPVTPPQPQSPQPMGPSLGEGDGGVLHIRQMPGQTIRPTDNGTNRPSPN